MLLTRYKERQTQIVLVSVVILIGVLLSAFNRWEIGGETWGYWFFARVFAETGKFVVMDRSPLYTLYLNLFRWMGYPVSVTVEFLVTSYITMFALTQLFKPYLGLKFSIFAVLLWLPVLQMFEPFGQNLALACVCWAIVARREAESRRWLVFSYSLLVLAYMFRAAYAVYVPLFAAWDIFFVIKIKGVRGALLSAYPRFTSDWPFLVVILLLLWFQTMQSSHPWNNVWMATDKWFPSSSSLATTSLIGHYNWGYIEAKYGTFVGHDFYFTHREAFNGATDVVGMVRANPRLVLEQLAKNVRHFPAVINSLTALPTLPGTVFYVVRVIVFLIISYGLYRVCVSFYLVKDHGMLLFVFGSFLMAGAIVVIWPKDRYMGSFIPLLALVGYWYGVQTSYFLDTLKRRFGLFTERTAHSVSTLMVVLFLLMFSFGSVLWAGIVRDFIKDSARGEFIILEDRNNPMKAAFRTLRPLMGNCVGLMSLEHNFFGAFMDNIPVSHVYDVWEIPPFGDLSDSGYRGLNPARVNCVMVSEELATGVGLGTNYGIRYRGYIEPYVRKLQLLGAVNYKIPRLGSLFILLTEKNIKTLR